MIPFALGVVHTPQEEIGMAKFGLFKAGIQKPIETYEGDYMAEDEESVKIWRDAKRPTESDRIVAVIILLRGWSMLPEDVRLFFKSA
jgi:hypothetical protein